ncbi:MAG TPA: hypothetical protein PLG50_14180 [bacterium]|nr:hypothetical protein [bacterium]HQG46803.1 hypothetical protein [bacterium]HQI48414.1 hypothetical protein [bacterium]HQJ63226.1 hypothetical protein [bacterium]
MQTRIILFVAGLVSLLLAQCDLFDSLVDPEKDQSIVEIVTNRQSLAPGDSITVTLYNHSEEPIFLEGCNPIYYSVKKDTGWVDHPFRLCFWEGYEREVPAGAVYRETVQLAVEATMVRFVVPVYRGCKSGLPLSQAECRSRTIYSSNVVQIRQPRH